MTFAPWQASVYHAAVQAHEAGRLGHALLLSGPPHMGKQDVAEALAKRLLCANPGADGFACGSCRSCHLFVAQTVGLLTTQAHPDLQRVSLEPNEKGDKLRTEISVDQIRRLSQWFALSAQYGRAKVAIIAPGDLMNHAAANALLKTLEEPAEARFLLIVSSRPQRLPATIRSRCQRLLFRVPENGAALAWLQAQGIAAATAAEALDAARGNPGLAAHWLAADGLAVRRHVCEGLNAIGSGRGRPIETAQQWLGDEHAQLRLRFAADLVLEAAGRQLGATPSASRQSDGLTAPADFSKLWRWFDAVNRVREQLGAPLRNDLVLAGLLHEWRTMVAQA